MPKYQHWSNEEVLFLKQFYPEEGLNYCINSLQRSREAVKNKVRKFGLTLTKETHRRLAKGWVLGPWSKNKKVFYRVPTELFTDSKQLTPYTAYILGLLWADGYILPPHHIALEAVLEDMLHFKTIFERAGDWRFSQRARPNRRPQAQLDTSNKNLVNFLMDHDYVAKSSAAATKILNFIPLELHNFWFLGLHDGDGGWYSNPNSYTIQYGISSNLKQDWTPVEELFKKLGISYSIQRSRPYYKCQSSTIRITGRDGIQKWGSYLYQNSLAVDLGLPRKYQKYLEIMDKIASSEAGK